jgi:hypothetical protein
MVSAKHFDENKSFKEQAGVKNLDKYDIFYEIQELISILNIDLYTLFEYDDSFCSLLLISNLEKSIFTRKYEKIMSKIKK